MNLTVKFDSNGCLEVPKPSVTLQGQAVNDDRLAHYGHLLREAQASLDRIPTYQGGGLCELEARLGHTAPLLPCSPREVEVFNQLLELNAEVVLRVLYMRRLVTAARMGR